MNTDLPQRLLAEALGAVPVVLVCRRGNQHESTHCRAAASGADSFCSTRRSAAAIGRSRSLPGTIETASRLISIPGIGPVTASASAASMQDASVFSGPREFAAFLGLTPRQNSSGGKARQGRVSKMGNRYLRKRLVVGAHAVLTAGKSTMMR